VLGLCNVALVWHLLTALKADIDNDRPAQVKGAEIVLWPVDYPRILRIVKDMEAAIQKHDLTETFAAWSFPNVPDMGVLMCSGLVADWVGEGWAVCVFTVPCLEARGDGAQGGTPAGKWI
jgi:hypothetical protein